MSRRGLRIDRSACGGSVPSEPSRLRDERLRRRRPGPRDRIGGRRADRHRSALLGSLDVAAKTTCHLFPMRLISGAQ